MIVLSLHTNGVPSFTTLDPRICWGAVGTAAPGARAPFAVNGPNAALAKLATAYPAVPDGYGLEDYRAGALVCLAAKRAVRTVSITAGANTYTLGASDAAQTTYFRIITSLREQLTAGLAKATDTVTMRDSSGAGRVVTVAGAIAAFALYLQAVLAAEQAYDAAVAATNAAQTAADLDAVTLG